MAKPKPSWNSVCSVCLEESGETVLQSVRIADTPMKLLVGLAWQKPSGSEQSMWLPRTRTIHTFGMTFALDIAFLDENHVCLETRLGVAPGHIERGPSRTTSVLETKAGVSAVFKRMRPGSRLLLTP